MGVTPRAIAALLLVAVGCGRTERDRERAATAAPDAAPPAFPTVEALVAAYLAVDDASDVAGLFPPTDALRAFLTCPDAAALARVVDRFDVRRGTLAKNADFFVVRARVFADHPEARRAAEARWAAREVRSRDAGTPLWGCRAVRGFDEIVGRAPNDTEIHALRLGDRGWYLVEFDLDPDE